SSRRSRRLRQPTRAARTPVSQRGVGRRPYQVSRTPPGSPHRQPTPCTNLRRGQTVTHAAPQQAFSSPALRKLGARVVGRQRPPSTDRPRRHGRLRQRPLRTRGPPPTPLARKSTSARRQL